MIKINLLPQEMMGGAPGRQGAPGAAPGGGTGVVVLVLLALYGLCAVLTGFLFYWHSSHQRTLNKVRIDAKNVTAQLDAVKAEYEATRTDIERMEKLISVAEQLDPTDRILWSRKLNMLPLLVPEGVYLTQIDVSQTVRERETDESVAARNAYLKKKGNKGQMPPIVKVPVFSQSLKLSGIAYVPEGTDTQRLQQITKFYKDLMNEDVRVPFDKEPKLFLQGFKPSIVPSPILGKQVEGRNVSEFSFGMTTRELEIR